MRWSSGSAPRPATRSTWHRDRAGPGPRPGGLRPRAAGRGARRAGAGSRRRSSAPSSPREPGGRGAEIKLALRARGINTSAPDREDAVIDMDEKGAALGDPDLAALLQHGGGDRRGGRGAGEMLPSAAVILSEAKRAMTQRQPLAPTPPAPSRSTGHTVSATRRCPAAVGCIMSAWLSESDPATPSSRNGTSGTRSRLASSG